MLDDSQIFLSYVREDIHKVEALYNQLTEAGFNVWMDTQQLLPGQTWSDKIEKAIRHSELVIICLSRVSVQKRGFSQREIRKALNYLQERLEGEIYLIPVRLDDCRVPDSLAGIQWVDLFAENGWGQLVKAITTSLDNARAVTKKPLPSSREVALTPSQRPLERNLLITSPPDAAQVDWRVFVNGRVSDPGAAVWLIVHYMDELEYWVQPPVSIGEGRKWGVEVYLGRESGADAGKRFEMMAVVNSKEELKEGMVLQGWPAAQERSQIVMVTRRAPPKVLSRPDAPRTTGDRSVSTGPVNKSIIITGDNVSVDRGLRPRRRKPKRA
jgi:hypothetical protein